MSRPVKTALMVLVGLLALVVLWKAVVFVAKLIALAIILGVIYLVISAWRNKR